MEAFSSDLFQGSATRERSLSMDGWDPASELQGHILQGHLPLLPERFQTSCPILSAPYPYSYRGSEHCLHDVRDDAKDLQKQLQTRLAFF